MKSLRNLCFSLSVAPEGLNLGENKSKKAFFGLFYIKYVCAHTHG